MNSKSIEKYLERVNYAHQLKQSKDEHLRLVFPDGSNWKNQITKPKMPNITDARRLQNQDLSDLSPDVIDQLRDILQKQVEAEDRARVMQLRESS